jgi:bacteriocin leader peptide (microcyclamide/patellamide family)
MNKKNITPNPTQPVERIPTGQLPISLAELSEETLSSHVLPSFGLPEWMAKLSPNQCSYDGDDAE